MHGSSSLQGILGTHASLSGTLGVQGKTTLAGLSAGATAISSTLNVMGKTTLAGLSAAATNLTSTLKVSGESTLGLVSATAVSISNTLGVAGKTTLAGLSAAATALTSTLKVSGQSTLAGLSAAATSLSDNLTYANNKGPVLKGTGSTQLALFVYTDNTFFVQSNDGTHNHDLLEIDTTSTSPDMHFLTQVTGNRVGNAAMNMTIGAFSTISLNSNANYTPTPGRYLVRPSTADFTYTATDTSSSITNNQDSYLPFDGTAYLTNIGSGNADIYIYKLAD